MIASNWLAIIGGVGKQLTLYVGYDKEEKPCI
jgi:hypothetical protein